MGLDARYPLDFFLYMMMMIFFFLGSGLVLIPYDSVYLLPPKITSMVFKAQTRVVRCGSCFPFATRFSVSPRGLRCIGRAAGPALLFLQFWGGFSESGRF